MTQPSGKKNSGRKRQKTAKKRGASKRFEPEILYLYWAAAGGKVAQAMRLAETAGEDRVPIKPHTWSEYAVKHGFAQRLKQEKRAQWEQYHDERVEKQQQVLDGIAHAFEELSQTFNKTIINDINALYSDDKIASRQAEKRLSKLFGSIDSIDRFFRMYLRARDVPERLTQQTMNVNSNVVGYDELEEKDSWAKSIEDVRNASKSAEEE